MNRAELLTSFQNIFESMYEIVDEKNNDYAGESAVDALKNFKVVEYLGVASVEQWFLTRITDKLSRVSNLIKQPAKVADEKITDTLIDMAVYAILFKIYLDSKL